MVHSSEYITNLYSNRKSSDYCQTVTGKTTPGGWKGSGIKSMKLHPWHENWLLVMVKRPDCKNLDHAQTDCPYDLFLTQVGPRGSCGCIEHWFLMDDIIYVHVVSMHSYLRQDLFGSLNWVNITADSNGKVAGFVDFDWGASLCPDKACSDDMKVSPWGETFYEPIQNSTSNKHVPSFAFR